MLAQAAVKIKAFNSLLAKPFAGTAEKVRLQGHDAQSAGNAARFRASFARSRKEIAEAQRLRYRVFSEEYGASFAGAPGIDRDRFDKHCLHLLVRDTETGELAGYTRILTDSQRHRSGGYYSEGEFQMGMVNSLKGRVAELGRTCIHPDYRGGAVIAVMWSHVAEFMVREDVRYLIGCASVSLSEDHDVAGIIDRIRAQHLSSLSRRVAPRLTFPCDVQAGSDGPVRMPPLLKAYLRMGATVCGEPCWDPDFNCLDFFVLLAREDLPARYVQHFLQPVQALAAAS